MKYYVSKHPWGGIGVSPMIFHEHDDDGYTFDEAKRAVIMHLTRLMEHWSKKTEADINTGRVAEAGEQRDDT